MMTAEEAKRRHLNGARGLVFGIIISLAIFLIICASVFYWGVM